MNLWTINQTIPQFLVRTAETGKENIMATMTLKENKQGTMKTQLQDILMAVSWSDISRTYFGKSNSWLYHKLDGVDGNKKPTEFTVEERCMLKGALADLADRIRRASDSIKV